MHFQSQFNRLSLHTERAYSLTAVGPFHFKLLLLINLHNLPTYRLPRPVCQRLAQWFIRYRSFLRHKLPIKNDTDPFDVFTQVQIFNPVKNGEVNLVGKQQVVQFFVNYAQFQ